jgi:pilus assembly protein Flp/PilA
MLVKDYFQRLWQDESGQDLVEYALAAGLVAVAAVAVMPQLTNVISNVFSKIGSMVNSSVH